MATPSMNPLKLMRVLPCLSLLTLLFLVSCKKETEQYQAETVSQYVSPQPGKYITYRTDSTVTVSFGSSLRVNSYQEKLVVDALLTDNLGRPSYRVFRYIRDTAGLQAWKPQGTLFITPTANTLEVIENNLRTVKLVTPVKVDNTWKGNQFLPTSPYAPTFDFSIDNDISDWQYTYAASDETFTANGKSIPNVVTVEQSDEGSSIPVTSDNYSFKTRSVEKYAKGLGLVFQEFDMWEYQPSSGQRPGYRGFGVKRSIIDHN